MTGSFRTGKMLRELRPDLHVLAETSGKDAMIITTTADPDQAVKDLVKSAFGHSGQKCSAASVAIVEASVYDNPAFLRQLKDAAASLKVGGSWEVNSVVTPLIREPEGNLLRALTQLNPGGMAAQAGTFGRQPVPLVSRHPAGGETGKLVPSDGMLRSGIGNHPCGKPGGSH